MAQRRVQEEGSAESCQVRAYRNVSIASTPMSFLKKVCDEMKIDKRED
jgi:hypothetical protein